MLSIRKCKENTNTFYFQIILVRRRIIYVSNVSILDKLPTKYKILSYIVVTMTEEESFNVLIWKFWKDINPVIFEVYSVLF